MSPDAVNIILGVIGAIAIIAGILTFRNAERITLDARRTLSEMFEASRPELFAEPTSPSGARGTGIGIIVFGLILVSVVVISAIVGFRWGV